MAELGIEKAIEMLRAEYARAEKLDFVYNPLAYALYTVWKIANAKNPKSEVDLTGKCGSCRHSVPEYDTFKNSTCYVRCTNQEHLSSRRYYGNSLVAVRQRTARACKRYERRKENA